MSDRRKRLLEATRERIEKLFGSQGATKPLFREVWRRAWQPGNAIREACTVVDMGQRRADPEDNTSTNLILGVKLVLDLADEWRREDAYAAWTDNVSEIIAAMENWRPYPFVLFYTYQKDEPFTVILGDNREEIWEIEFEVECFEAFPEQ